MMIRLSKNRQSLVQLVILAGWLPLLSCLTHEALPPAQRPKAWAQPKQVEGVGNFHRVSATLYRGEQPTAQGFVSLKQLGIRTVVNLRLTHSDKEALGDLPLQYVHIPMAAWDVEHQEVVQFLKVVTDSKRHPVFVHCLHGADRTGMMVALYRVVVDGWSKAEAIREMKQGGFGHHMILGNLTSDIEQMDIAALKEKVGLSQEHATSSTKPR